MNNENYPSLNKGAFNCTRCDNKTPHKHFRIDLNRRQMRDIDMPDIELGVREFGMGMEIPKFPLGLPGSRYKKDDEGGENTDWNLYISVCSHCHNYTVWENERIIFPSQLDTPRPSFDMPKEVKEIYNEANLIYN